MDGLQLHIESRLEVIDALVVALGRPVEVVDLVGHATSRGSARNELTAALGLSAKAAEAILDLRLFRFTRGAREAVRAEQADLRALLTTLD
jgi:DNA gyrase/topoisomerase IV subunit A